MICQKPRKSSPQFKDKEPFYIFANKNVSNRVDK